MLLERVFHLFKAFHARSFSFSMNECDGDRFAISNASLCSPWVFSWFLFSLFCRGKVVWMRVDRKFQHFLWEGSQEACFPCQRSDLILLVLMMLSGFVPVVGCGVHGGFVLFDLFCSLLCFPCVWWSDFPFLLSACGMQIRCLCFCD